MSNRYPFAFDWRDEAGVLLVADMEVEVEVEICTGLDLEPYLDVFEVWLNEVELMSHKSPTVRGLGCLISEAAEHNETIVERALQDEGIAWRGRSANDPSGRFRFASAGKEG